MTEVAAWGGFTNGNIPASKMAPVLYFEPIESGSNTDPGINSNLMMPEAAHQLYVWQSHYMQQFSKKLIAVECYRGIIRQKALYELYQSGGTLAAVPGTSNHGWGRAVDLGAPVSSFGTPEHIWCAAHAAEFGFEFDVSTEAWHASYTGNPTTTTPASVGEAVVITPVGDIMSSSIIKVTAKKAGLAANVFLVNPDTFQCMHLSTQAQVTYWVNRKVPYFPDIQPWTVLNGFTRVNGAGAL